MDFSYTSQGRYRKGLATECLSVPLTVCIIAHLLDFVKYFFYFFCYTNPEKYIAGFLLYITQKMSFYFTTEIQK